VAARKLSDKLPAVVLVAVLVTKPPAALTRDVGVPAGQKLAATQGVTPVVHAATSRVQAKALVQQKVGVALTSAVLSLVRLVSVLTRAVPERNYLAVTFS
jgi:tetrahydromethanopterin S-methyltransferase subunit D